MENCARIVLPGRWAAWLAALLAAGGCREEPSRLHRDRDQARDTHPTTTQTIERASALYQEKLGFSTLFLAGEFRRLC